MSQQYTKILAVMQAANGPVSVSTIKAIDGIVATRLSTYLWEIRKHTGCAIKANRDGRTVVSYELVGAVTMPTAKPAKAKPAKAKPAKAKPVAKAATVKPAKVTKAVAKPKSEKIKQDLIADVQDTTPLSKAGVVNVFDEIDSNVESFEDQQFAEDFVRGL
jgi:hypothetical protein